MTEAQRTYQRAYRARPERRTKQAAHSAAARRRNGIRFMSDVRKALPCTDCDGRYPACVMDFDHIDASNKTACVGTLVASRAAASAVFDEIAKCELVCANCHRIRTMNRHNQG